MTAVWSLARWAALAAAVALLNASLTFDNVWPTLGIRATPRLSPETLVLVLGLAAGGAWRGATPGPMGRRVLAVLWLVLVVVHYLEVTSRSLYGRSVNLYWDLKLLPDVGAMFAFVAEPRLLAALIGGVVLVPLLLYAVIRWALGRVADACRERRPRQVLAAAAALAAVTVATPSRGPVPWSGSTVAPPVSLTLLEKSAEFVREAAGVGRPPLPPSPDLGNDLRRVRGADVILFFVESYGAASWDRTTFATALADARAGLGSAIADTGRAVVTARVESTTFGGESWLAHISLLSGTEVRDPDVNRRLMTERRDTLVTTFTQNGYRTLAIMPGLQAPWPEGGFYGFDRIYGAGDLGYQGPPFGWWDVTDQFVLARMNSLAMPAGERPPAFVFVPSISTHAPFTPVPPYQPDWARMSTPTPYDRDDLMRAYDDAPDWTNLGPGYARALAYTHETLAGYLRLRADRDLVMVIVGDHQPPAVVSGEGASWDVPVHVIASRPAVLERLRARGFADGLAPPRPALARMDSLLSILLDAFGEPE